MDDGEWLFGSSIQTNNNPGDDGQSSWSFNWDTTEVDDGFREFSVRMVNNSGKESQIAQRSYTIDNIEPAPSLRFVGDVEVLNRGMPAEEAYQESDLNSNSTFTMQAMLMPRIFSYDWLLQGMNLKSTLPKGSFLNFRKENRFRLHCFGQRPSQDCMMFASNLTRTTHKETLILPTTYML